MGLGIGPIAAAIIPALLGGAGQFMTAKAQQDQAEDQAAARNRELMKTLEKNDAIAAQSREVFDKRRGEIQPDQMGQAQEEATASRTGVLEQAVAAAPPGEVPLSGSAPDVVQSEVAKKMQTAVSQGKDQARALGKAGGYGDTWFGQGIANQETGRNLDVNNNFASGNMAILPYLQDFAEIEATKPISPIGGVLSGFGGALGSFMGGGPTIGGGYQPLGRRPAGPARGSFRASQQQGMGGLY
jgi:hypothetical protein